MKLSISSVSDLRQALFLFACALVVGGTQSDIERMDAQHLHLLEKTVIDRPTYQDS